LIRALGHARDGVDGIGDKTLDEPDRCLGRALQTLVECRCLAHLLELRDGVDLVDELPKRTVAVNLERPEVRVDLPAVRVPVGGDDIAHAIKLALQHAGGEQLLPGPVTRRLVVGRPHRRGEAEDDQDHDGSQ
jgi:hypothetical protein